MLHQYAQVQTEAVRKITQEHEIGASHYEGRGVYLLGSVSKLRPQR